jgi:hypothetical protein
MTVLEERGFFWWHHELIPDKKFATDSCVPGLLKIDDEGRITVELDGRLPSDQGPMSVLTREDVELSAKRIEGVLKVTNQRVLLSDLWKDVGKGRFNTNGPSYEGYGAMHCLVGDHAFPKTPGPMLFKELEIELKGLEEWFRLGSIQIARTKTAISAKHKREKRIKYALASGKLALNYNIYGPYWGKHRNNRLELSETVSLARSLEKPATLENMRMEFGLFEDLFVLLTDSEYPLNWPTVYVKDGKTKWAYKWYFLQLRPEAEPPKYFDSPTNFVQLRDKFGDVVSAWLSKREKFGPGFYLYLAIRRGMKFYPEHRFVNLIWGLEALHRKKYPDTSPTDAEVKMKAKVARIVAQIKRTKDRNWLDDRLKNAHEPNLEQRIFDVLSAVPIDLDSKKIRAFAKRCAELRNEISHFGSQKHGGNYQDFFQELSNKAEALSVTYHSLILHEIGIEEDVLKWWIYEGPHSYKHKRLLAEGGLLDA